MARQTRKSRRKGLGWSETEHRKEALEQLKYGVDETNEAERYFNHGKCGHAVKAVERASYQLGVVAAHLAATSSHEKASDLEIEKRHNKAFNRLEELSTKILKSSCIRKE